jgi:hypothetical protein
MVFKTKVSRPANHEYPNLNCTEVTAQEAKVTERKFKDRGRQLLTATVEGLLNPDLLLLLEGVLATTAIDNLASTHSRHQYNVFSILSSTTLLT